MGKKGTCVGEARLVAFDWDRLHPLRLLAGLSRTQDLSFGLSTARAASSGTSVSPSWQPFDFSVPLMRLVTLSTSILAVEVFRASLASYRENWGTFLKGGM